MSEQCSTSGPARLGVLVQIDAARNEQHALVGQSGPRSIVLVNAHADQRIHVLDQITRVKSQREGAPHAQSAPVRTFRCRSLPSSSIRRNREVPAMQREHRRNVARSSLLQALSAQNASCMKVHEGQVGNFG